MVESRLSVRLTPQHKITIGGMDFKIDFVVTNAANSLKLAIELDGHDFHEKTPHQAAKDRSRERALTRADFTVVRFAGSEIIRNPRKCVEEVTALIEARQTTSSLGQ